MRMSRLIGFLAVGLGGFSTWLECPHNNTRKRTEPGPAQALVCCAELSVRRAIETINE